MHVNVVPVRVRLVPGPVDVKVVGTDLHLVLRAAAQHQVVHQVRRQLTAVHADVLAVARLGERRLAHRQRGRPVAPRRRRNRFRRHVVWRPKHTQVDIAPLNIARQPVPVQLHVVGGRISFRFWGHVICLRLWREKPTAVHIDVVPVRVRLVPGPVDVKVARPDTDFVFLQHTSAVPKQHVVDQVCGQFRAFNIFVVSLVGLLELGMANSESFGAFLAKR